MDDHRRGRIGRSTRVGRFRIWFGPDDICADAEGAIWYARVPRRRCTRVAEGGRAVDEIEVDRGSFGCMLGGNDGRTLFIVANHDGAAGASGGVVLTPASTYRMPVEPDTTSYASHAVRWGGAERHSPNGPRHPHVRRARTNCDGRPNQDWHPQRASRPRPGVRWDGGGASARTPTGEMGEAAATGRRDRW